MKKIFYFFLVLLVAGCKEVYEAPYKSPATGYLVVEGVINSGQGSTTLTLSRTTKLDNRNIQYEQRAQVNVEGEDNSLYNLQETDVGKYTAVNLNLNAGRKYRVRIKTNDGKEYLSDFAVAKTNPPVDSISWKRENNGLQVYINTHDPLDNTRYYQWDYDETWEFHSAYTSSLKYEIEKGPLGLNVFSVVYRDSSTFSYDPKIFTCWQFNSSKNLLFGSSAKLSKDIIYLPLVFVPQGSQKLTVLYSINVKQYALTKEGYEFLEKMKKNTEATGSIFDAQPSELKGNIRCVTDPAEPAIGFFTISSVEQKRIFIRSDQVPGWSYNYDCEQTRIENISDSILRKGPFLTPTNPLLILGVIKTFNASELRCVDCTLSGTNIKPAFWP
jgi:Domain of unknown function (DUF4249)